MPYAAYTVFSSNRNLRITVKARNKFSIIIYYIITYKIVEFRYDIIGFNNREDSNYLISTYIVSK